MTPLIQRPHHTALPALTTFPIIWLLLFFQGVDGSKDEDDGELAVGCTKDHFIT